jgi:two-component sensor histidine kinase
VVGHVISRADESSPQGRAFITGKPSICNDLRDDSEFILPPFYAEHGIISTIDVLIKGGSDRPYGVLEIDNNQQHDYDEQDIDFLTGFANVLAEAVDTSERTNVLEETIGRMKDLVEEKDRLLDQKQVLAEELQHRVRNNLQLVHGMLTRKLDEAADPDGQKSLRAIARRVSTLAQVYDQLLGAEMTRTLNFGNYVKALCDNLSEVQALPDGKVTLTCDSELVYLDLDAATALGIVVAELVTNSYDHAFPGGKGSIRVAIRASVDDERMAIMTIADDGRGFVAESNSKRHGLGLVRRLVEQVRGVVKLDSDDGAVWTIDFPIAAIAT